MNPYHSQDAAITDYVNRTFAMYDFDGSNTLDPHEFSCYLQDWYANMGYQIQVTQQMAQSVMMQIDANSDGVISREELFYAMKRMWETPQQYIPNYQPAQQQYYPQQRPTVIVIKGKKVNWWSYFGILFHIMAYIWKKAESIFWTNING